MSIEKVTVHSGGADLEANALKEKILSAPDTLSGCGITYYFSENGKDSNDGLSKEKPLKSFVKINELPLKAGDVILFERGSVFRTAEEIILTNGVNYGAYGEGDKPKIFGSLRDYADPSIWEKTENPNIWCTELKATQAGMLNFNNDESFGSWKYTLEEVVCDGDFYHDEDNGIFYLYLTEGNPGEVFNNIEIGTTAFIMKAGPCSDIKVENICFKYATFGPFRLCLSKNVHITNCEMGWHGGRIFSVRDYGVVRYGNAVELWAAASDVTVDNCWFYQIFDAAVTFQGRWENQCRFTNIKFENNLIEYSSMNIECWADVSTKDRSIKPHVSDISVKGNIVRFGGYGWGGTRVEGNQNGQAMFLGWSYTYDDMHNFVITENTLDCADCHFVLLTLPKDQEGFFAYGNTYFQKKPSGRNKYMEVVRGVDIIAENQEDFEKAIKEFDAEPAMVKWLSK